MSTWSYTKGADRTNGRGASMRFGKGHDYDHWKKPAKKKKIKYNKVNKQAGDKNQVEMKLASKLYQKLKKEPDFKHLPWKELWDMAVSEVKRSMK